MRAIPSWPTTRQGEARAMVGAKIGAQAMARSAVGTEHFQPPVATPSNACTAALDGERIVELGRSTRLRQARPRLPGASGREKMAGGIVALGGGEHRRGPQARMGRGRGRIIPACAVAGENMDQRLDVAACLPADRERALLIGRAWVPEFEGPALVAVRGDTLVDLSPVAATASEFFEVDDPVAAIRAAGDRTLQSRRWRRRSPTRRGIGATTIRPGSSHPATCRRSRRAA